MEPCAERDIGEIFAEGTANRRGHAESLGAGRPTASSTRHSAARVEDGGVVELDPYEVQISRETDDPVDPFTYGRPASRD